MNFTIEQTGEFLKNHDGYLILTHVRPDGDTVGCAAALCRGLRDLGKTAHVLPNPETTSLFSPYLEGLLAPEDFCPETVVSVDMAARGLFPDNAQKYLARVDLAIDHHPSQEFFARETCLDTGRAACGELMYDILRESPLLPGRSPSPSMWPCPPTAAASCTGTPPPAPTGWPPPSWTRAFPRRS